MLHYRDSDNRTKIKSTLHNALKMVRCVKYMFALPWLPHVSLLHTIPFLCSEANAIACCVSGLLGVLPSYSDEEKANFFVLWLSVFR